MDTHEKKPKPHGKVKSIEETKDVKGADLIFSPDYTVTSTTDGGGTLLTNVEVIICYWGSFWSATPAPSPSSDDYTQAIQGILTGPYLEGLNQYRGLGQGTVIYTEINDSSTPADLYTDANVVTMLTDRIQNHGMPAPIDGHNRFYFVVPPQGIRNSLTGYAGQHQSFVINGVRGYYAWTWNTGSLTGHNCVTKVFSHELTEAMTDPAVDVSADGILVNGTKTDGTPVTNDEIGDTCNEEYATVNMNGVQCSVQSYWSKQDNTCILPLGTIEFTADKNRFGKDEVNDQISSHSGLYPKAFWVNIKGFSKNSFQALSVAIPTMTGSFTGLNGVTITQNTDIFFTDSLHPEAQQIISIPFDIKFTSAALNDFPSSGTFTESLTAVLNVSGTAVQNSGISMDFYLVAGANPYFNNIDPSADNVFYLSQDLRVFTATPAINTIPVAGAPAFTNDTVNGAFNYIQALLGYLNTHYINPTADPFNTILPQQSGALQGDSSVTPLSSGHNNYNFAIARVRLTGTVGPSGAASNVRVFFRLWSTQSADTDYQPGNTYPFNPDAAGLPGSPKVGTGHHTIPFFASGNLAGNTDYNTGGANIKNIQINSGDSVWAYFGCFLNLYDTTNTIDGNQIQTYLTGTHHCLVAEIAYDDTPLFTGETPETSDKLAQRNLSIVHSDNPGPKETHRVPQTFDIRPSAPVVAGVPVDELMIDWGTVPLKSTASIYWPQVSASQVIDLAATMYRKHNLVTADANTIQCEVIGSVTYIPIPAGTGDNFAGLLTVDLPATIVKGQEFNVVVRRLSTYVEQVVEIGSPAGQRKLGNVAHRTPNSKEGNPPAPNPRDSRTKKWKYVVGTFQVKIPVTTSKVMLGPDEDTLAIMKWRLQQMQPVNRWHPVLIRYISILSKRIDGLGGNAATIPPSLLGAPQHRGEHNGKEGKGERRISFTGKITSLIFDRYGDFAGFVLDTEDGNRRFSCREPELFKIANKAWEERILTTVYVELDNRHRPEEIVLHYPVKL